MCSNMYGHGYSWSTYTGWQRKKVSLSSKYSNGTLSLAHGIFFYIYRAVYRATLAHRTQIQQTARLQVTVMYILYRQWIPDLIIIL